MPNLRDQILDARAKAATPELARQRSAQLRASAVIDQFNALRAAQPKGLIHHNGVAFASVTSLGGGGIAVRTAPDSTEDDFRIFNPPTLVRGGGEVMVNSRPFREDPLAAVAEVILQARTERTGR